MESKSAIDFFFKTPWVNDLKGKEKILLAWMHSFCSHKSSPSRHRDAMLSVPRKATTTCLTGDQATHCLPIFKPQGPREDTCVAATVLPTELLRSSFTQPQKNKTTKAHGSATMRTRFRTQVGPDGKATSITHRKDMTSKLHRAISHFQMKHEAQAEKFSEWLASSDECFYPIDETKLANAQTQRRPSFLIHPYSSHTKISLPVGTIS